MPRDRGVVVLAVAVMAVAALAPIAFAVAPAGPGECREFGSAPGALAEAGLARGMDGAREPETNAAEEVPDALQGRGGRDFRAVVPTYVHVISPDGVEAMLPASKVREQVRVLTRAFGGSYGGVDTGFRFDLVSVDYTVNAEWYNAGFGSQAEREMKAALRQGGTDALNVYLTTASIYLGWATFPSALKAPGQVYLDGIVVDWKSLPGLGFYPRFDLGFTAVHETGHWLNLYHTFQGGCNRWGDYVDDTPPQRTPSFGCPIGKDTCADPGEDPIHNFMDYSDDPCYFEFTAGQAARMQDAWLFWRAP